jgi:hypothetical protein
MKENKNKRPGAVSQAVGAVSYSVWSRAIPQMSGDTYERVGTAKRWWIFLGASF